MDVKRRIKQFESDSPSEESSPNHMHKPAKHRPHSQAFDVFESSGIIISPVCLSLIVITRWSSL